MTDSAVLKDKHIVLGVTGSIAAYKAADLVRRLRDYGAEVRVVMTRAATEFITPLTLQSLSGHPVAIELLDADQESAMGHIALARWADCVLVAPASADFIARHVHGRADDLLNALILATEATVNIAPAMNNKMWQNMATQDNLVLLRQRGVKIIGPASGDQACGETGEGRLVEPLQIVTEIAQQFVPGKLAGKKVVITAGPTYEPIDPVRFIGNRSSGKMGFAIAKAAQEAGADVTLIAGPVAIATPDGVERVDVETTKQMLAAVNEEIEGADIFIACAAVADFKPTERKQNKVKKRQQHLLSLDLEPTTDILATVSNSKVDSLFTVGFAAETDKLAEYAQDKLRRKNLDMVAANWVGEGKGFAVEQNALEVFWQDGHSSLPLTEKTQLAQDLITLITEQYYAKNST